MDVVLARLDKVPVLDLGMRVGDGAGAVAVLPLLQMAARLLAETATVETPAAEPIDTSPPVDTAPPTATGATLRTTNGATDDATDDTVPA
jgi:nicotinate-nucleotide--dimethylbenzimidazole phosphoribosyltransferase